MRSPVIYLEPLTPKQEQDRRLMRDENLRRSELRCAENCSEPSPFLQWLKQERKA